MKPGQVLLLGIVVAAAAITVRTWPEIARYLKLRSM